MHESASLGCDEFQKLVQSREVIKGIELQSDWLQSVELEGVVFEECWIEPGSVLEEANLRETNWKNCEFPAVTFKSCNFKESAFEACKFYYADTRSGSCFRHSDLSDAQFHSCDLRLTTFPYCELFSISFSASRLNGASFEGCDFGRLGGKHALKPRATFTDCQLTFATLCDLDMEDCVLTDCDLTGGNLANTNLSGADMRRTRMVDAEIDGADLSSVDMRGGELGALYLHSLRSYRGLLISASQQHHLLMGLGIKVEAD